MRGGERAADAMEVDEAEESQAEAGVEASAVCCAMRGLARLPAPAQAPQWRRWRRRIAWPSVPRGGSTLERTVMAGEAEVPSPQLTGLRIPADERPWFD